MVKLQKFAFLLIFTVLLWPVTAMADDNLHTEESYINSDFEHELYHHSYDELTEDDSFFEDVAPTAAPAPLPPSFIPTPPGQIIPAQDRSTEYIPSIPHPTTSIFYVTTPMEHGPQVYAIIATSPITGVERLLLEDNRLALDIINSTTELSGALPVPPFMSVSGIRVSQFTANTTRVVFDLESGTEFSISITPDRMIVLLTIHQHSLRDFSFEAGEGFDTIILSGITPSAMRAQPGTGVLRFLLSNTQLEIALDSPLSGSFATHVTLSAWGGMASLEFAVQEFTSHTIWQSGPSETTILLQPATYRNIRYSFEERTFRIPKAEGFTMHIDHASRFDLYHHQQFILWFPADTAEHLGFGEILINDAFLRSVVIAHSGGQGTQLIFNGNQIFTLDLQEDDEHYIIRVLHPRERYQRIVIIDPGHGGRFPGAVAGGFRESDLNLQVTNKLLQIINSNDFMRAYTVRNADVHFSEDIGTDLRIRGQWGNNLGDIFISIHHNAARGSHVHGIETFYREHFNDNFRLLTNRNLSDIMHRHKLGLLGSADRGVQDSNFAVLRYSSIPSTFVELGFMTNPQELARMLTPEFQWQAAWALYNGLMEAFMWIPERPLQ